MDVITLKVKRTKDAKKFPLVTYAKHGDVGMDLPAVLPIIDDPYKLADLLSDYESIDDIPDELLRQKIVIEPNERGVIPTGIAVELPDGYWASIEARSGTSKSMLICPKGVIDEGYRGEMFGVLINVGKEPVTITHGERYVQLIIQKRTEARIIEVDELEPSERGDSGFNSTGRKTQIVK